MARSEERVRQTEAAFAEFKEMRKAAEERGKVSEDRLKEAEKEVGKTAKTGKTLVFLRKRGRKEAGEGRALKRRRYAGLLGP
ncbi:hypothetical protein LTR85_001351 [Meristemomyces frigidus]|nr:hypothetical protein LTR85_001351 [Meristemomyces frigidus]